MNAFASLTPGERAWLVAFARTSIERGSRSFAAASRLFSREMRERVWLLYAWARACDDLADGQQHGGAMADVANPQARLVHMRLQTARALAGERTGEDAFDALGLVAVETGLTPAMADAVIEGFAFDVAGWRPRSEADLYRYCYHVAGAIGVMMAVVMGIDPENEAMLDRASDLGIAFQLSNVARDLMEDDAAGRCYLPTEWLAEVDIPPGQHMKPPYRLVVAALAMRLTVAAEPYEASARVGARKLPFRARWAVLSATDIYCAIGRKVAEAGDLAWDTRIRTGKAEKLGHLIRGLFAAAFPMGRGADRAGLWSRSRLG